MDIKNIFSVKNTRNLTMLVDFYELTMAKGYLDHNVGNKIAYFDMFFRRVPDGGGYCIMAGVQQLIEYLSTLKFTDEDIEYLRSKNMFSEQFLDYLKNFKFECDVWAIPEGNPVFPGEPLVTVKGPVIQAQFIETMILLTINHQTLIATKSNRICRAAEGRPVMEFGSRRAQGYDGAIYGARAAIIGGCNATACTIAEQMFDVPCLGTMAHSWVQLFPRSEEHTSELQSRQYLVCRLLLEKKNNDHDRGPVGPLVKRQQVARERHDHREDQQDRPDDTAELASVLVGSEQEHAVGGRS